MSDVSVRICPSCGGKMVFIPEIGKMKCEFCENTYEVEAATEQKAVQVARETPPITTYEQQLAECTCQSCGAAVCAQNEVISLGCPYCGNALVITSRVSSLFHPDGIIPFRFGANEALQFFQNFTKKLWFVPKSLKQNVKPSDFRAMYAPYYLFDFDVSGEVGFANTKKFAMEVNKLPLDASTNFPNDLMDNISPYDYQKMIAFSSDYLRGFMGEVYNENRNEFIPRATAMVQTTFDSYIARELNTLSGQKDSHMTATVKRIYYVLLPVYLFSAVDQGKRYFYAVNGQTGRVAGNVPYEKKVKSTSKLVALIAWFFLGFPFVCVALFLLIFAVRGTDGLSDLKNMFSGN